MSNLYSTIGDVKFYNYISNNNFAGVPNALIASTADKGLVNWIYEYAFNSLDVSYSSLVAAWRFPKVVGTPTEPESTTVQVTTPSSATTTRFGYRFNNLYSHCVGIISGVGLGIRSSADSTVNLTNSGTSPYLNYPYNLNSSTATNFYTLDNPLNLSRITFGVKSPTTMVFAEFWLNSGSYQLLSNIHSCSITVHGWMHSHNSVIFNNTSMGRAYAFSCGTNSSLNLNLVSYSGARLVTGTTFQPLEVRYYQISCTEYTNQELFLTDLILYDSSTGYGRSVQLGKVDNRIVCLGRGNFQPGLIYKGENIFGRTGIEYWVCACSFMTTNYQGPITYNDLNLPSEIFKSNNRFNSLDRDYLLFRVNLRTDLP
jgi:hypothetical protein